MPEYTFHNVTITVVADSAHEAYDKLVDAIGQDDWDYQTSTYSEAGDPKARKQDSARRPTAGLWPCTDCGGRRDKHERPDCPGDDAATCAET